ncbi:MAG TPA: hypothetical protein VHO06_03430 [Polyangia bacterium]|nr:hypothetical protein [Polyangia bacterium]
MIQGLIDRLGAFGSFLRCRKAAVSVVVALALPALIAFSSLVAEYGHGLLIQSENQRVADLAAYAGALAYNTNGTDDSMRSAVRAVAALNGVQSSAVAASLINSPTGDGNQAVQVTVSTNLPIYLASVVGGSTSLPIKANSYAELNVQSTGCIIALSSGGAGVTLSGGTSVTASGCAVASNASETVPCGTYITSKWVSYNTTAPSIGCNGIRGPNGTSSSISKKLTADPLAGNTGIAAATARLTDVANLSGPSGPTVTGGGDVDLAWNQTSTKNQLSADGCSGSFSGNTWTVTCTGQSSYTFGNITTGGGININFNTSGASSTTYNFSGYIKMTGTSITFGPGTYNIAGGLYTGGGTTTTFGAGTFNIGTASASAVKCSGAYFSICNTGTLLTFGGPSSFTLQGGIYNGGGEKIVMGSSGTGNSYNIGPSSNGYALYFGGGATIQFGDATDTGSLFQLVGNFQTSGGSCVTLAAAAQHDIHGALNAAGGVNLGSGVYTITDYVDLGGSAGGDVTCNGVTVGMNGSGVTWVIGGNSAPTSGGCSGQAFCLAAGYNNVTMTAPTSGDTAGLVVIGPTSATKGALFAEGASNTSLSGAFYFPEGPISLTGGASVGGGTGQCLELIGTQVTLAGGTAAASNCVSGSASNTKIALVK